MAIKPIFLSAAAAAAELGISRATLYAYVSRGLIRSEPATAGRNRLYHADDIRGLRDRRDQDHSADQAVGAALHLGLPVLDSEISLIHDGALSYRGRDAVVLARDASFEAVSTLLWNCRSDPFAGAVPIVPRLDGPTPIARAMYALTQSAASDPSVYNMAPEGIAETGARILRLLTAALTDAQPSRLPIHEQIGRPLGRRTLGTLGLVRAILVLLADHELNASTFAVRVVASTGANVYFAVLAGLAALQGPRHGGGIERVLAFLDEIPAARNPGEAVEKRLKRGEGLPGFGHPLYPKGDPRAVAILERLEQIAGDEQTVARIHAVTGTAKDLIGEAPNVDFAMAATIRALGWPDVAGFTLFAVARAAGWVAHFAEQIRDKRPIRPRARYVGQRARLA